MKHAINLSQNVSMFVIHANQMDNHMNKELNAEKFNNLILSMDKNMNDIKDSLSNIQEHKIVSNHIMKYKNHLDKLDDKIGSFALKNIQSLDSTQNYVMSRIFSKLDLNHHKQFIDSLDYETMFDHKIVSFNLLREKIRSLENAK